MATAYHACNQLVALSRAVGRRSSAAGPLETAATRLRQSLVLAAAAEALDKVVYWTAARRLARRSAGLWWSALQAGTIDAEEHHAARESLYRVLFTTPA